MLASSWPSAPLPFHPPANPLPGDPVPPVDFRARLGRSLRVCWDVDLAAPADAGRIHRTLCRRLLAADDIELTIAAAALPGREPAGAPVDAAFFARLGASLSGPIDVTLCHQSFPHWHRPETGKLVVMQPWVYGHLPRAWAQAAREQVDEIWVPSRCGRDTYVRSGVPAEKVHLVPAGIDPECFTPEGPALALPTSKACRFLFVGSAAEREGLDLLLGAYYRALTTADDVCLVIQLVGPRDLDGGSLLAQEIRRTAADPRLPPVIVRNEALSDDDRAALYRACSCLVLPYRAVAFGLPALEAMACGRPATVTAGGATDDFVAENTGWRVPYYPRSAGGWAVGPYECAGDPWQLEPDREALVEALRAAYAHPEERQARGEAARAAVHTAWTWEQSLAHLRARLSMVVAPRHDALLVPARLWSEPERNQHGDTQTRRGSKGKRSGVRQRHVPAKSLSDPSVSPCLRVEIRPELSLCMIVRDEEPRLPKCLESVGPYVDEIVVVDTGSADGTREVARDFGARVYEMPWPDSFAAARNQGLELARGSWILRMDADDEITPEHGAHLKTLIRAYPERNVVFTMEYRVPPGPDGAGGHVVDQAQLWPHRPDLRFEHRLHEQMLPAVWRAGLPVLASGLTILHRNYDWTPAGQRRRRLRDFRLLELELKDRPEDPFTLFNLGMTYLYTSHDYEVAAHYLQRSLARSDWQGSLVRVACPLLAAARIGQGDWATALAVNEKGRQCYPDDAELLRQAAEIYEQAGRPDEARRCLERLLLGCDESHYRCLDEGLRTYRGRDELARLLRRQGGAAHAEQLLREVVQTYPFYLPAQIHLAEAVHAQGRTEEARLLLAQVPEVDAVQAELQQMRAWVGMG